MHTESKSGSMTTQRLRILLAVIFFVAWLVILLAGADNPPPWGFVWVVVIDAVAAGIVYLRSAVYMDWCATQRRNRLLRATLEGLAVGIVVAALLMILNPAGEPGIDVPSWSARAIWFVILGIVGAVNAMLVYWGSQLIYRLNASKTASEN